MQRVFINFWLDVPFEGQDPWRDEVFLQKVKEIALDMVNNESIDTFIETIEPPDGWENK